MKILQLLSRAHNRSGSGIQMMQLALELARRGHQVTCAYGYGEEYDDDFQPYKDSTVRLQRLPFKSEKLKPGNLSDVFLVRRLLRSRPFDLVHTHSNAIDHAWLATIGQDLPIIANRGMSSPLKWKNSIKYRSRKVGRIIAVSDRVRQVMVETGRIPPGKISVVYGSVDTRRFRPQPDSPVTRESLGIAPDARIVGYTGSIGGRKGIDYLVEAFARLHGEMPNTVLLLVGIERQKLARNGIDLAPELEPSVRCVGFQHRPEQYMSLFDVSVFPGIKSEGLTGAIRETAAMAIPAVTTDIGGNRELIENGNCGLVVQARDVHALAGAICSILQQEDRARRWGRNGRNYVEKAMSISRRTDQVEQIYRSVLPRLQAPRANLQEMMQ